MKLKILSKKEVKQIHAMIEKQWGCAMKLDYAFLQNSKGKVYIANKEVFGIDEKKLRIDSIGMYFGKVEHGQIRLSIEGSQMIGPHAKKNVIKLEDVSEWLRGENLNLKGDGEYMIVNSNGAFYGCGKHSDRGFLNYLPRARLLPT